MKKILILLITVFLAFGMISCFNNAPNIEENNNSESEEEQKSQTPNSGSVNNENAGNTDAPPPVACAIEYMFSSVKDLNTYITTGSKDIEDYLFSPYTPLNDMPDAKIINAYGYNSIFEYFSFDESNFDSVEASFTFTEDGSIIYKYYFDNIFITIQPVESDNLLEYYKRRKGLADYDISLYTKDNSYKNGHILRENSDCNVIYDVVNGIKKVAYLIIDNSYITINGIWYSDDTSMSKDYNEFMVNKDATAFSSFFSDDDIVFNNAAAKTKKQNMGIDWF